MTEGDTIRPPVVNGVPFGTGDCLNLPPAAEQFEYLVCGHSGNVTEFLSRRNRFPGVPVTGKSASVASMPKADPKAVARRLRAVQKHLEIPTVEAFADSLGAERSRVSGWVNGYNLPPVPAMVNLIGRPELRGLTLDWVYIGKADAVPMGLVIKLTALEQGVRAPRVA